jgi:molecular chaperone HtpG
LRTSPCRLVSAETGPQRDLERVRRMFEEGYQAAPRILELNPKHPLIHNLARKVETDVDSTVVDATIEQLFANQLLREGIHPNPADMITRIESLLEEATKS